MAENNIISKPKKIAIFASGAGSNAKFIIEKSLSEKTNYTVALVVSNKPDAGVLAIAKQHFIPTLIIEKEKFFNTNEYTNYLVTEGFSFIILAGFLWKVPSSLIQAFPDKIINIHPSLLPKYGGKGMYGKHVHEAVIANNESQSGISIHYVNEKYDDGKILLQATCMVDKADTSESLATKIHELEHEYFWQIINSCCK